MTNCNLLSNYASEIGAEFLSLEQLIISHRSLRDIVKIYRDETNTINKEIRDRVKSMARDEVINGEYIAIEKLSSMTVLELTEFISNNRTST